MANRQGMPYDSQYGRGPDLLPVGSGVGLLAHHVVPVSNDVRAENSNSG